MPGYILALDQGTTGSTCIVFDEKLNIVSRAYREVNCFFPKSGWVSQGPEDLWTTSLSVMNEALRRAQIESSQLAAIGITNQRETTIIWERSTGRPIHEAIVWQCRRTAPIISAWEKQGLTEQVAQKTGLLPDAYFSASKIAYILDNVPGARERAKRGELCFGTVDSWILWNLTGGRHVTEPSNASRTMLYNINDMGWDCELLEAFDIPESILPEVVPTISKFGVCKKDWLGAEVPVMGIAGDQQSALFGQCCFEPGDIKNTYGTGCFLVMNIGSKPFLSKNRLLTTVAWQIDGKTEYALEGSVFSAGSAVQWLRDGLRLIRNAAETEEMALRLPDNEGVYFVPAFSGLGAPYWDPGARAAFFGITRDTRPEHYARAILEASAYQTRDLVDAMTTDVGTTVRTMRVDGGMTANNFLMQFQADILNASVMRPQIIDSTALGAASLAGIGQGLFDKSALPGLHKADRTFYPEFSDEIRDRYYGGWKEAVSRSLSGYGAQ